MLKTSALKAGTQPTSLQLYTKLTNTIAHTLQIEAVTPSTASPWACATC